MTCIGHHHVKIGRRTAQPIIELLIRSKYLWVPSLSCIDRFDGLGGGDVVGRSASVILA
jgi:hypothetical protein